MELTDDFKMPVLKKSDTESGTSLWLWRSASNWSAIYYEGEAFVPKSGMQFRIEPVWDWDGYHQVIFDGNGGTETLYDENGASPRINTTVVRPPMVKCVALRPSTAPAIS